MKILSALKIFRNAILVTILLCNCYITAQIPASAKPQPEPITANGSTLHLVVSSARPLADALDALQKKYGWMINYEDPQFVDKSDIVESSDKRYVVSSSTGRPHTPNGTAFTVDFPANAVSGVPDAEKTLRIVIEAYNKSSNPGKFVLMSAEGRYDVVGVSAHGADGKMASQASPFDAKITLVAATDEKPTIDALTSICEQAGKVSGQTIALGVFPRNLMARPISVSGSNLAARDLLVKALAATEHKVYWRLLYDVDTHGYFLNLHMQK
jgi:hypothetical protein